MVETNLASVKMLQNPLSVRFSPKPRLFALIIGINYYDNVRSLRGAAADALSVKEYLENNLGVPSEQIRILLNKSASRAAIIDAFLSIRDDGRIEEGDPIFIYYAGHGSEIPSPEPEVGSRLQVLVPRDYCPTPEKYVGPIPDRTIGALIAGIAEKKGDNITIVFDCCHSASGTRGNNKDGLGSLAVRSVELEASVLDQDLDRDIWDFGRRSSSPSPDLLHGGLNSHVLIAACSASERATEADGRGSFSSAFLKLLRSISPDELRYRDILTHMDIIPHQNPQCEGANQKRYLFNSRVSTHTRTSFKVALQQGQFILEAGAIAGIAQDTEFTVHTTADSLFRNSLGTLVVEKLGPFSATLKLPPGASTFVLAQAAVALPTKMGQRFDLLLYVPDGDAFRLCREALQVLMDRDHNFESIHLVDNADDADFELVLENEKVVFLFRDQRVTQHGHTRLFEGVESTPEDLADVLKAAAYFYWKMNRTNINPIINSGVQVELYKLLPPKVRRFNEIGGGLVPIGPSLYDTAMEVVANENIPYGFKLTNNTAYDLYPNLFYFDLSDLSIVPYYETPTTANTYTLDVPLPKNGGVLTIGYGSGGAPAQTFYLRPGQVFDIGFLKIFLSTKPVDLSSIAQSSPFEKARSSGELSKTEEEAWGTMLIPVLQRLSDPESLQATQQTLRIQELKAETLALKREIDILHSIEARRQDEARRQEVAQHQEVQRYSEALLALKTELQQEKAERQRLETLLHDRRLQKSPELVHQEKQKLPGGWHMKKLRWW
ncbi:hypothetical protein M413DRAFT_142447 [Hebeloma cylindrosporum]|uniref:Peptidase C14 caspase domain-containing protein n=1 Tax=Hebeloma cylindrosporum TaxID=76867 RepID=A0A0C2YLU9_HEBCY|nr:hypothetical protein M413DRAFT_142447 [Hebeloma cylindrosporum h7]